MGIKQTPEHVLDDLRERAKRAGSKLALARETDVPEEYIHRWLLGICSIPDHELRKLGWEREVVYRKVETAKRSVGNVH